MEKKLCAGTTTKGKPCRQTVKNKDSYCKDHRPRFQKILKHISKFWVRYGFAILLSSISFLVGKCFDSNYQDSASAKRDTLGIGIAEVKDIADITNANFNKFGNYVLSLEDEKYLNQTYNLGYILFERTVNKDKFQISNSSKFSEIFDVDWANITIEWNRKTNSVNINMPKLNSADKEFIVLARGNNIGITNIKDHSYTVLPSSTPNYLAIIEVVSIEREILVLGFQKR